MDERTVTASADGVHVQVTNTTGIDLRLVADPVQDDPTLTIPPGTSTRVILTPPGEASVRCDEGQPNAVSRPIKITVEDPHGFYRSVNVAAALGCEPGTHVSLHDAAWGVTPDAAAHAYADQVSNSVEGEVTVTKGNGYRDHGRHEFLLYVGGQGYGTLDVYRDVRPEGEEQFRASYGRVCMERVFPDHKPGTEGG